MLSHLKRFSNRKSKARRSRRFLGQSLERLEQRQLLAADLDFSTFYPSTDWEDGAYSVAQDVDGNAYVADYRYDPVTFEFETGLSKLSPSGQLLWSQELPEYAADIAVDDTGLIYAVSATSQDGLPVTPDAPQSSRAGGVDFYVMILDGTAMDADAGNLSSSELVFASYLGGTGDEGNTYVSLDVDSDGGLYLGGETASVDFPTTSQPAVDSTYGGGTADGVVAGFAHSTWRWLHTRDWQPTLVVLKLTESGHWPSTVVV